MTAQCHFACGGHEIRVFCEGREVCTRRRMSCFLSHAWHPDESHDVHAHVPSPIAYAHGVSVWMDVDMLRDDVDAAMARDRPLHVRRLRHLERTARR